MRAALIGLLLVLTTAAANAEELRPCFVPGQDCTSLIVHEVDGARSELLVQAYGFTSAPIIRAIGRAKERGVEVKVILDKINEQKRYTGATYLVNHGIAPLIDYKPAIAHNKVMVIDGTTVITGSFNFTRSAQERNAENVLVISDDRELAAAYAANWKSRAAASRPYRDFRKPKSQPAKLVSNKCIIKGNINRRGEHIYHLRGERFYERTRINTSKGERWFCSEAQAQTAGWRKAAH